MMMSTKIDTGGTLDPDSISEANERLAKILGTPGDGRIQAKPEETSSAQPAQTEAQYNRMTGKQRRLRSDAGTKRPPKPQPPAPAPITVGMVAGLTEEQAARVGELCEYRSEAHLALYKAQNDWKEAEQSLGEYLESLTAHTA